jgi:hypothetical protein
MNQSGNKKNIQNQADKNQDGPWGHPDYGCNAGIFRKMTTFSCIN